MKKDCVGRENRRNWRNWSEKQANKSLILSAPWSPKKIYIIIPPFLLATSSVTHLFKCFIFKGVKEEYLLQRIISHCLYSTTDGCIDFLKNRMLGQRRALMYSFRRWIRDSLFFILQLYLQCIVTKANKAAVWTFYLFVSNCFEFSFVYISLVSIHKYLVCLDRTIYFQFNSWIHL